MPREPGSDDATVLAYLRRRWRHRLDATTIPQAQRALALPPGTAQRLRLHDHLAAHPAALRTLRTYGESPLSLTLTDDEKLLARRVLAGATPAAAAHDLGLPPDTRRAARRVLRHAGILRDDRPAPGADGVVDGVGLNFHTIRIEGESTFGVH